ncbi:hypothetical protein ACFWOT_28390 [Streptomyces sp. NPDC058440]|uniref:hypothetical protein n=1 Tax=Streptomyces sp. NPDC058440 TaxID=3346501 RepID=UPI003646CF7E
MEISMPTSFTAFCASRFETYVRYATLRLRDEDLARQTAREAFGDLAMVWAEALESSSPSALAWRLLAARTNRAASERDPAVYRVLPREQADAVLLKYCVGLSAAQAADVLGWTSVRFDWALHEAVRTARTGGALG